MYDQNYKVIISTFSDKTTTRNQTEYPTLYKLSELKEKEKSLFWCIQNLADILSWIGLIHSKYNSTLSQESCNKLNIDDVFESSKYNKWGDIQQWNQKWQLFKNKWNNLKLYNVEMNAIDDDMKSNSIYSSLMSGKHNNKIQTLQNNQECIESLININNEFLNDKQSII